MFGKFIILAIVAVLLYALFIRTKARITNATEQKTRPLDSPQQKRRFWGSAHISKIHLIITFLALLYLIWAVTTLYR